MIFHCVEWLRVCLVQTVPRERTVVQVDATVDVVHHLHEYLAHTVQASNPFREPLKEKRE